MHAVAFRASPQEKDRFQNKLRNAAKYDEGLGTLLQGDSGGLRLGWVDLDLLCSTILLGQ